MDKILPQLLTYLTGHRRQKVISGVNFEWSSTSWVHNIFRVYELVFWRREGIRPAISAYEHPDGHAVYAFHSIEAVLNYAESKIRGAIPQFELRKVYLPVFSTPGAPVFSSPYLFAIAVQNTASAVPGSGATRTLSMVVGSGSDLMLFMAMETQAGTDPVTGVTFNTVEVMTQEKKLEEIFASGFWLYLYALPNPTVTTANIVAVLGTNSNGFIGAVSYTGVNQSATLDSTVSSTQASGSSFAQAFTTIANNCWTINLIRNDAGGASPTASTGSTQRVSNAGDTGIKIFDSNGAITPAGSYTMNYTSGASTTSNSVGASFAPPGGTPYTKTLTESLAMTDSLVYTISRTLTETLTMTANFFGSVGRTLTETLTMIDVVTTLKVISTTLSEVLTMTDTFLRSITVVLTETLTMSASFLYAAGRTLSESLTMTDTITFAKSLARTFTETLTMIDTKRILRNGSDVVWTHIHKAVDAIWTKIQRS